MCGVPRAGRRSPLIGHVSAPATRPVFRLKVGSAYGSQKSTLRSPDTPPIFSALRTGHGQMASRVGRPNSLPASLDPPFTVLGLHPWTLWVPFLWLLLGLPQLGERVFGVRVLCVPVTPLGPVVD